MKQAFIASTLVVLATLAHAQTASPAPAVVSGATIAGKGVGTVPACVGCHGANGEGNAAGGFPRLAGQSTVYLAKQLDAYADGRRANPIMSPIASGLSAAQRGLVARFYADAAVPSASPAAASGAADGRRLAVAGDERKRVQACANCHGPDGIGEASDYPYLAGQHAGYLVAALGEWKSGARKTDPSGQMPQIAAALSDAEIQAVAAYYAALPAVDVPVARRARRDAAAQAPARATATVVSGPSQAAPLQGRGTEQGAPVVGGTSGIGGNVMNPGAPSGPGAQGGASAPRR